jgi:hypothetical protein
MFTINVTLAGRRSPTGGGGYCRASAVLNFAILESAAVDRRHSADQLTLAND